MDLRDDKNTKDYFKFNNVYAVTDVSGALGIDPIGLTLTVGNFSQSMTNSNNPTKSSRAIFSGTGAIGGSGMTPDIGLDIGIMDFVTLLTYASFDRAPSPPRSRGGVQYKFGLKLGEVVKGLNFIASYSGENNGENSDVKADFGYEIALGSGMTLTIPASVLYVIKYTGDKEFVDGTLLWGAGLKFSGMGITFNVGVGSEKNSSSPGVLDANLAYSIADFSLFVNPWMSLNSAEDVLEAVDFGVSYGIAETMLYLGYVVDLGTEQKITVAPSGSSSNHQIEGGGLYIATKISF